MQVPCMKLRWWRALAARRVAALRQRPATTGAALPSIGISGEGYVRRAEMLWGREGFQEYFHASCCGTCIVLLGVLEPYF